MNEYPGNGVVIVTVRSTMLLLPKVVGEECFMERIADLTIEKLDAVQSVVRISWEFFFT